MKNSTFLKYTPAYFSEASIAVVKMFSTTTAPLAQKSLETYEKVKEKAKSWKNSICQEF